MPLRLCCRDVYHWKYYYFSRNQPNPLHWEQFQAFPLTSGFIRKQSFICSQTNNFCFPDFPSMLVIYFWILTASCSLLWFLLKSLSCCQPLETFLDLYVFTPLRLPTMEPRYNEGEGTGKICSLYRGFVISRFFFIYYFYYYWGKENNLLYQGLR